ncbi:hypothetical protein ACFL6S_08675 [Candidatus Poribacteria bacterium]
MGGGIGTIIGRNFCTASIIISIFWLCFQTDSAPAAEIPAEQLYEKAFRLIVEGDYAEAYDRLEEIIALYPNTTYARFAETRRQRLDELNLSSVRRRNIDQSGRMESVVFGTLYSTWLGIGTARLADADSEKSAAAGMMIGAPVGLLTSLALTRNARLSDGQAALVNFGGYWGTWQGFGLTILLDKDDDEKTMIGGAMAGGILGLLTTSTLVGKIDPSLGDSSIVNYGGIWGTWLAFVGGVAADVDDSDNLLGLALAGGNLGAATMAALSSKLELSFTQASLINLSGIVGTIVSGGLLLIAHPDSERVTWTTVLAGGVLGLAGGYGAFGLKAMEAPKMADHRELGWAIGDQRYGNSSGEIQASFLRITF